MRNIPEAVLKQLPAAIRNSEFLTEAQLRECFEDHYRAARDTLELPHKLAVLIAIRETQDEADTAEMDSWDDVVLTRGH